MHQDERKPDKSSNGRNPAQKCKYEGLVIKLVTKSSINKNGYLPDKQWKTPILPEKAQVSRNILF